MPVFVGSLLRVALGALVLAPFVGGRWHQVRQLGRRAGFGIVFAGVLLISWEHARMSGET
jgi:hypothetical protein